MVRKHTPYFHQFMALGAEMVDRIGFDSAFKFTSVENEHLATRTRAGLYDVYYQVLVDVKGADAEKLLQRVLVNDVGGMTDGKVLYSSMCNDKGGMIDDLTCFRLSSTHFWLCPTPSRVDHVTAYLTEQAAGRNAAVTNLGAGRAFISVQGPLSRKILAPLTDIDISGAALPYYSFARGAVAGVPNAIVSRTGYSGELGFELFYPGEYSHYMYAALLAAGRQYGMEPCGLGALRSVRIEKRYPLDRLDVDETTSPIEAGLGWTVRFDKGAFIGCDALGPPEGRGGDPQIGHGRVSRSRLCSGAGLRHRDRRQNRRQGDLGGSGLFPRQEPCARLRGPRRRRGGDQGHRHRCGRKKGGWRNSSQGALRWRDGAPEDVIIRRLIWTG